MSLRNHITGSVTLREVEVVYQDDKFLFRALSDASTFAKGMLQDPRTVETDKGHYRRLLETLYPEDSKQLEITDETVRAIKLVHTTLQSQEWDKEKKSWVELKHPYDVQEILQISVEQGQLFHSVLVPGAMQAMGYTEAVLKGQVDNEAVDAALAGNSLQENLEL